MDTELNDIAHSISQHRLTQHIQHGAQPGTTSDHAETLRDSILKTLSYFFIFSTPLTREELYHYLWRPPRISFEIFCREFFKKVEEEKIKSEGGYYFLASEINPVAIRERRTWHIEKKMKIARRAAKLIRFVPFVKAFFVCNQIQIGVTQKSDIDVLIIVEQGRLYITRLLVTLMLGLFRLRRGKKKVSDRVCLSFYATHEALDFSLLQASEPDIYFVYWLATLLPVYDPENYLPKIFERNAWATASVPHVFSHPSILRHWKVKDGWLSLWVKKFGERVFGEKRGDKAERFAKKWQRKYMQKNKDSVQNQDTRVVISDTVLKFHENDRRGRFRQEWEKRWKACLMKT